jgi:hypothetical protein
MRGLIADLRHALTVYRSTPLASTIAVVALAASMACVSAFLSMWSDLSLKPPIGFERGGRLVTIGQSGGYASGDSSTPLTLEIVEGINETVHALDVTAGVASFPQVLHRDQAQQTIQVEAVTQHFSNLRPRLHLGRAFDEQDHWASAEPVAILSYRLWQEQFAGRSGILGETVQLTEEPIQLPSFVSLADGPSEPRGQDYRIAGVMSPRMTGTFTDAIDVWLPYEQAVPFLFGAPADVGPGGGNTGFLVRHGVSNVISIPLPSLSQR